MLCSSECLVFFALLSLLSWIGFSLKCLPSIQMLTSFYLPLLPCFIISGLKPISTSKIKNHSNGNNNHSSEHNEIGVFVMQFGKVVEIGSINTCNES